MTKPAKLRQCGIPGRFVGGLALFFSIGTAAAAPPPDSNYVLIEDRQNPERSRLLIFSSRSPRSPQITMDYVSANSAQTQALTLTRSVNARERVKGLTLLSGMESPAALNAALVLLSDPNVAVREEAFELVLSHPQADFGAVVVIGQSDASERIRELVAEHLLEREHD